VEKVARKFKSFEDADKAKLDYYRSLTPGERVEIALKLHLVYYGPDKPMKKVARIVRLEES